MNKDVGESLSAMVDGELDPGSQHRIIDELIDNANARQVWQRYHIMRDTLKRNLPDALDPGFFDRVCDAVAQEPAHQAQSSAKTRKKPLFGFGFQPAYGFVAAAALVVAVVTVTQIERSTKSDVPLLARSDVLSIDKQAGVAESSVAVADKLPTVNDSQLFSYLANHTARSRSYPMHDGLLPYVRSVEYQDGR
ncbi:MAG: hypothetical protein COC05_05115 [Gammaproteobacteria bacterium]|nr:MAG: hypothetical protein COC05_05115 [Gammaproteobacteria bacterium]